jgi:predicted  nucleic acid-binding Zn-ribbon protein
MGKTINPKLTKEFLLDKAKYYSVEIEKVYEKYNITGNSKKSDLNLKINENKNNLSKGIADIEAQIEQLQKQLEAKRLELSRIDNDNAQEFAELQLKIEANNMARQKIQDSINLVVTGIKQYL